MRASVVLLHSSASEFAVICNSAAGKILFNAACQHDLEGIVAKHRSGRYVAGREETTWFKIRNRSYSQWAGREEMFDRAHEPRPEGVVGWDSCAMVCSAAVGVVQSPR